MAENSVAERGRGPGRPFTPGTSGNPGGRPRAVRELLEQARASVPAALELAERLVADEQEDSRVRLEAAKLLMAYGLGSPPKELPRDPVEDMTDEELADEVARIIPVRGSASPGPR
jgi:hypothetical protein